MSMKELVPIVAKNEGKRMMTWIRKNWAAALLVVVLVILGLLFASGKLQITPSSTSRKVEDGATKAEEPSRVQNGKIILDQDDFASSGIKVQPVTTQMIPSYFEAPAEVQLAESRVAHVTPGIAGIIRKVERGVGDPVAKGSALCTIESVDVGDARSSFVAADSERQLAERNYARWKLLVDKGLRTQNELFAAETELTRAKLKLEAATARLRGLGAGEQQLQVLEKSGAEGVSNGFVLRSPIAGSVLARSATVGQNVTTLDQIFQIGDLSSVWVQAVAHEQDLPLIKLGMSAVVQLPNSGATFAGKVSYIGEQVDEKTRTVPVRVEVRNGYVPGTASKQHRLLPGLFTTLHIETGRKTNALVVPASAIQSEGAESFVFVQSSVQVSDAAAKTNISGSSNVAFERRLVEVGTHTGNLVGIVRGLTAGEKIVVENAYLLKSELEKSKVQD